jgi:hypothetical protein
MAAPGRPTSGIGQTGGADVNNGARTPAPAAPPATPQRPATQDEVDQAKLNNQQLVWNDAAGTYMYVPLPGVASGPNSQTALGTTALQTDLARRQAAPNQFTGQLDLSGQFGSGQRTTTVDPAAAVAAAGASGRAVAPRAQLPGLGAASPYAAATAGPTPTAQAAQRVDLTPQTAVTANPSKVQTAADQARTALGPAPKIDMGVADRQQGTVDSALGLSRQVVNAALAPQDTTALSQATADARAVLDQMLNGPNTAERIGSQTLRTQLALARSAAGGPGAVQDALRNAQAQAPELEAQAAQSGTQETLARQAAAGNVATALGTTALGGMQQETNRINSAAQAASGFAQGALGAKGQDIEIAKSNQSAASNLLNDVAQTTGVQLNIDQQNQELIGQMARDANATDFNWGSLDQQTQEKEFDRWVSVYGIDQAAAAQIKAAAVANKRSVMDYVMGIVGSVATVGAAAAGKKG